MLIGKRILPLALLIGALLGVAVVVLWRYERPAPQPARTESRLLARLAKPFTGDLPEIRARRTLRVLVSYSKTDFYIDRGKLHGFEYELLQQYEKFLNKGRGKGYPQVRVYYVPTPFDKLLDDLAAGRGDIAAAGLTITPERQQLVDFTDPYFPDVSEIVVTNGDFPQLSSLSALAGRRIFVPSGTSYEEHLKQLSRRLEKRGLKPIRVEIADGALMTEDYLDMANAGIINITVADRHIAKLWAGVLDNLVLHDNVAVHTGGAIGWAVRKGSPKLLAGLNAFIKSNKRGTLIGNVLFKRYFQAEHGIRNPLRDDGLARLDKMRRYFERYGEQYGFDWLMLAAQGFQESGLDNSKRSAAGAIGVMQVMPGTAADKVVDVQHVDRLENNIHAGAKYLHYLRNRYFSDAAIPPLAQAAFSLAAYNAGPAAIKRLRTLAAERGLDANRWFANVEQLAGEQIGREPVDYVANINKYYVAYRLYADQSAARPAGEF